MSSNICITRLIQDALFEDDCALLAHNENHLRIMLDSTSGSVGCDTGCHAGESSTSAGPKLMVSVK